MKKTIKEIERIIARNIKKRRYKIRMSQQELSKKSKMTQANISMIENNKYESAISIRKLYDLCEALRINQFQDIFNDKENEDAIYKEVFK